MIYRIMRLNNMSNDNWETPKYLFDHLNKKFNYGLDVCASKNNHKCDKFFTIEDDALKQPWTSNTIFCNPPYSNKMEWIKKGISEIKKQNCIFISYVLPSELSTRWGEFCANNSIEIEFIIGGRVNFIPEKGVKSSNNGGGTMVVNFGLYSELKNPNIIMTSIHDIKYNHHI